MSTRQSVINRLLRFEPEGVTRILKSLARARKNFEIDRHGNVKSPGKYEGEQIHTIYFHELVLDGFGNPIYEVTEDESGNPEAFGDDFLVEDVERYLMPTLGKAKKIRVTYSEQGFVGCEVLE